MLWQATTHCCVKKSLTNIIRNMTLKKLLVLLQFWFGSFYIVNGFVVSPQKEHQTVKPIRHVMHMGPAAVKKCSRFFLALQID